jgi:poly(ribitol-phosphate) beta-N-acetylglucosaminyltransferase
MRAPVPAVSVVMAAKNYAGFLPTAVGSVLRQTFADWELIVVDDGSTDGTGDEADRWAAKHPELVRVHHAEGSGGPAKPRNTGLELATGRYVFFLDADDYLGAEALERLVTTADDNSSDIVLGRMASTTERSVPGSMFQRTELDVNLFESRVYWTLAALKLFRRELLETNKIRFPTHFPNCSDQPFTAMAYLRARKISVLSDYDYYFAELRDDGMHVTKSGSAHNRLDVIETMCNLLVQEVPDPDNRAPLLTRHFQIDLRRVVKAIELNERPEQERLLQRVTALVRTHLSPDVSRRLTPDLRVVYDLAGREMLDEMLVAFAFAREEPPYDVQVEQDRVFAHLPFFRDASVGVPDECYDITDRVAVEHELTSYSWTGTTLQLAGTARFRRINPRPEDAVEVLLRKRDSEPVEEYAVPTRRSADDGFAASLDLLTIAGEPLSDGFWDVFVRLTRAGAFSRTARFGLRRADDLSRVPSLHHATRDDELWTVTSYFTATGNLSVDAGQRKFKISKSIHDWTVAWHGLDLSVRATAEIDIDAPVAVVLVGEDQEQVFPGGGVADGSVSARLPVEQAPAGQWSVQVRVGSDPAPVVFRMPADPDLPAVKWRHRLRPWYALPLAERGHLVLRIAPVDVLRGVARTAIRAVRPGRS